MSSLFDGYTLSVPQDFTLNNNSPPLVFGAGQPIPQVINFNLPDNQSRQGSQVNIAAGVIGNAWYAVPRAAIRFTHDTFLGIPIPFDYRAELANGLGGWVVLSDDEIKGLGIFDVIEDAERYQIKLTANTAAALQGLGIISGGNITPATLAQQNQVNTTIANDAATSSAVKYTALIVAVGAAIFAGVLIYKRSR